MEPELQGAAEFVRDKLYFTSVRQPPSHSNSLTFFCIDNEYVYEPFYADFGPLNLGHVYTYWKLVKEKLRESETTRKKVVHYSSLDPHKRANAAYLMGAFAILELGFSADDAWKPLRNLYPAFPPFRDASYGLCTFGITLLDCFRGIQKAVQCGFINFSAFNVEQYKHYERVENGDLNVIVPGKFVAFSGPSAVKQEIADGIYTMTPEDYHDIFRKLGVTAIVRLNKKVYDRRQFTDAGFRHYDMYFIDGGTPSEAILRRFIEVAESEQGALAVHCKAGLGRTGTLMALYIMKHFRFTAQEVIAYMRVCRPGMVIGPQQYFLKEWEQRMWKLGEMTKKRSDDISEEFTRLSVAPPGSSPLLRPVPPDGQNTPPRLGSAKGARPNSGALQNLRVPPAIRAVPQVPYSPPAGFGSNGTLPRSSPFGLSLVRSSSLRIDRSPPPSPPNAAASRNVGTSPLRGGGLSAPEDFDVSAKAAQLTPIDRSRFAGALPTRSSLPTSTSTYGVRKSRATPSSSLYGGFSRV